MKIGSIVAIAAGLIAMPTMMAAAQDAFPSRPLMLVVPFAPGGPVDTVGRLIAEDMSRTLNQTVVVENRPGGSTMIAGNYVLSKPADGHTLLINASGMYNTIALFNETPFEPANWQPISLVQTAPYAIAVNAELPIHNLAELKEYIAREGSINGGIMFTPLSTTALDLNVLERSLGVKVNHITYNSASTLLQDLIANRIQITANQTSLFASQVEAGNVRLIAMLSDERAPGLGDIPTATEQGVDLTDGAWFGIFTKAGTEPLIVDRLNAAVVAAVGSERFQSTMKAQSVIPTASTPDELARYAKELDYDQWLETVRTLGLEIVKQ